MNKDTKTIIAPAIRSRLGDWWYYSATLTFKQVAEFFKPVGEINETRILREQLQREITGARRKAIAEYLIREPQHFFNSVVAGIYGGNPDFFPLKIRESPQWTEDENELLTERVTSSFGYIKISDDSEIFAIDGQHRVEGIKAALDLNPSLSGEELSVVFVAHECTTAGRERTRRLFSTLNRYAVPVSTSEIIALSEDDSYAVATRRIFETYFRHDAELISCGKTAALDSDSSAFTSLITLYGVACRWPIYKGRMKDIKIGPAQPDVIQTIQDGVCAILDGIRAADAAIDEYISAEAPERKRLRPRFRSLEGGNLLFRPKGFSIFCDAVFALTKRKVPLNEAVQELMEVPMLLATENWEGVLWSSVKQNMLPKNDTLATNLLLHYAGFEPNLDRDELLEKYRRALESPSAVLPLAK